MIDPESDVGERVKSYKIEWGLRLGAVLLETSVVVNPTI
jgi:hypothetical protein